MFFLLKPSLSNSPANRIYFAYQTNLTNCWLADGKLILVLTVLSALETVSLMDLLAESLGLLKAF